VLPGATGQDGDQGDPSASARSPPRDHGRGFTRDELLPSQERGGGWSPGRPAVRFAVALVAAHLSLDGGGNLAVVTFLAVVGGLFVGAILIVVTTPATLHAWGTWARLPAMLSA